jgi:hypothetical protein
MRGDPHDKVSWFYRDNPLGEAQAFLLETSDGPGPVGCCGLGERTIFIDGQPLRGGLLADFAVDKEHRTVLPALILQRALSEYSREQYDLTYAFPNESAVGVLSRVGLPLLGRMGRYVRILHYAPFLGRHAPTVPLLTRLGGSMMDAFSKLSEAGHAFRLSRRYRLKWQDDVDSRFDGLWEKARHRFRCIGDRRQHFLRWRLARRPGLSASVVTLTTHGSNELLAYAAIVEKEPGVALLADFLALSHEDLLALLTLLWPTLRQRGFQRAVTLFLGSPDVSRTLTAAGLSLRQPSKFVVIGAGNSGLTGPAPLTKIEDWYITEADRDN